jgi:hypothetical protein
MVYRGHVRNGRIELDDEGRLPEGVPVEVSVAESAEAPAGGTEGLTLYDHLKAIVGCVDDLPPDASINVGHYLYGHPKR